MKFLFQEKTKNEYQTIGLIEMNPAINSKNESGSAKLFPLEL